MFDRWCAARYRRLSVALILGCSIASIGATASATIVLEPHAGTVSSDKTGGAAIGSVSRVADAAREQRSAWPWLIIAALIGLAPLAVERIYRGTATRRRHSRNDGTSLVAELEELRALDRRHRAILEPLDLLTDGIEITDAEGRQVYCNTKHREFFPKTGHLHVPGARRSDLVRAAAHSGEIADAVGREEEWIENSLAQIGPRIGARKNPSRDVHLADGRTLLIRSHQTQSGGSVILRSESGNLETARATADAEGDAMNERGSSPSSGDAGHGRRLRILLAEDNEENQRIACAHLLRAGYVVDIVENGQRAIAAIQRTAYDVVLMDIQMPGMDGVAAIRAIRELGDDAAKVPIIALTANAMGGDREKYLSMGADDYISKPIESKELFGAIERFCGTDPEPQISDPRLEADPRLDNAPEIDDEAPKFIASLDDPVKPSS